MPRRRDALLAQQSFVLTVSGITPKCLQFYGFCVANVFCIVDGTRVTCATCTFAAPQPRLRSRRSRTKTSLSINCFRRSPRVSADCRSLVSEVPVSVLLFHRTAVVFARSIRGIRFVGYKANIPRQNNGARYTFSRAISSR